MYIGCKVTLSDGMEAYITDISDDKKTYAIHDGIVVFASDCSFADADKPHLILHRGLPGSGKTYAVKKIDPSITFRNYEADQYFMKDGVYNFNPAKLGSAHGQCKIKTEAALKTCKVNDIGIVIVSNTFTTVKEMKPYMDMANQIDIPFTMVHFGSTMTLKEHFNRNTHGVPMAALEKMQLRWHHNPFDIIANPIF